MDTNDMARLAKIMGELAGETDAQMAALFRALFRRFLAAGVLIPADVTATLDDAAAQLVPGVRRNVIDGLRVGWTGARPPRN